ncbi:phospholipase A2 inhibitor and Ly6/PLAUR domain-containing protein-like isoform X2 [Thamnophis elegans]|uniref:phospholipase A2 inhibitor and Ly6/PLAUR domain-containing protein-like isoform X2 n=1 Tax=Thamnophis elegans TaxID=35005 RepID=UPI0013781C79|nr:phospholipase A2 inhibitor and Ly6/PLAUR domain-containing protein-like isoform X2 [Thamnophis elegans]
MKNFVLLQLSIVLYKFNWPVNLCRSKNWNIGICAGLEGGKHSHGSSLKSLVEIPMSLTVKECVTRENCFEGLFSSTTVDSRFEIARGNCCQTDLCNAEVLPLENYEDFQPNGLLCPGCFALDEDSCEANQSVACVGEQDLCFTIACTTVSEFSNQQSSSNSPFKV